MYSNNARKLSDSLLNSSIHKSEFINQLILYDQLIKPTSNLMAIPVLRLWLGDNCFQMLVRENIILFARHDDWLSYTGNGVGLGFFKFISTDSKKHLHLGSMCFLPIDQALNFVLNNSLPPSNPSKIAQIVKLIIEKTICLDASKYHDKLKHETYTDILNSPILLPFFKI